MGELIVNRAWHDAEARRAKRVDALILGRFQKVYGKRKGQKAYDQLVALAAVMATTEPAGLYVVTD